MEAKKKQAQGYYVMIGLLMGFPIGIALSLALGNFAFVGTGIAVGLPIGIALEEKAKKEGRVRELNPADLILRKKLLRVTLILLTLTVLGLLTFLLFRLS
ncbi:hypothetical protein [Algoriphagus algorifonticola]|uniref:hypothetical protein n=1 Tax=Algoriphagus algorifonticola TaxID=2593007 RepID=UPI0011AB18AE|nr:hypothetical protein [Algoriphagus algorifonticola]